MRAAAGIGAATGELLGGGAEFFSAEAFSEFCFVDGADGFGAGEISRREGCSTAFDGAAAEVEDAAADDEESG